LENSRSERLFLDFTSILRLRRDGEKGLIMSNNKTAKKTIPFIQAKKEKKEKIVAITAYDFPVGKIVDECGIDLILVGDSLGMVVLGYKNTIPVTMDDMIHHTRPVVLASKSALIVGDMPYFSFHLSNDESVYNASRFLKEAGASAVKIEGASRKRLKLVEALVEAEIPVMGHVGLTPQSIYHFGQFKVKGKEIHEAENIVQDALNLEKAGVFSIILECIPMEVARIITEKLKIPTIGIGAGPYCDGQILQRRGKKKK
jgi:3-methyl-2-oxobutanoate hydroxymethyltransferase